jgi:hypothetical protein
MHHREGHIHSPTEVQTAEKSNPSPVVTGTVLNVDSGFGA